MGDAPAEVLEDVLIDLQDQFSEEIGGDGFRATIEQIGYAEWLRLKMDRVQSLIDIMRLNPCQAVANELSTEGYSISMDNWEEDLNRVAIKAKNMAVELAQKTAPLMEQMQQLTSTPAEDLIILAGVVLKDTAYSPVTVTAYQFCVLCKRYNKTHDSRRADKSDS